MEHKAISDFTPEEKEQMETVAVNYIIAQSDGFQYGYAQALNDFTANITDYWEGTDDKPQKSILDLLVDLGVELGKRKVVTEKNIETAKKNGYEQYYHWEYKTGDEPFTRAVNLFTRSENECKDAAGEAGAPLDNLLDVINVRREVPVKTTEFKVGDIIDFTLTTGEQVSAMAMRQEEDGMLFVFVDCLKDDYPMNKGDVNDGGYEACDLRKTLNNDILTTFPDKLKARMKPVYKDDKLRLLTEREVFGENEYGEEDNGVLLEPMKERRNLIASYGKGADIWASWWLQNRAKNSAADFAFAVSYGYANYTGASSAFGVRPAFKI